MANLITFPARGHSWSTSERLTLLEIHGAFDGRGRSTNCEHGATDEGDLWTVFYDVQHGSVVAHVAKVGRNYALVWPDQSSVRTPDLSRFVDVVRSSSSRHALMVNGGRE